MLSFFYILAKFVLAQTKVRKVEEIIVEVDDHDDDEDVERGKGRNSISSIILESPSGH